MIQQCFSLKHVNTFGVNALARYYVRATHDAALFMLFAFPEFQLLPRIFIGQGSNVLFVKDFEGWVVQVCTHGLEITKEDDEHIWLKVAAGMPWHELVQYCVSRNYGGLENLSLIPGNVGAAPIQNIGAYGVEVSDVIESVQTLSSATSAVHTLQHHECEFEYRSSVFKRMERSEFVITYVTFKLKKAPTTFHIEYGEVKDTLAAMGVTKPSVKAVSDAVIKIRQRKLPDPAVTGNAGSFFKNPILSVKQFYRLQNNYPDIPKYAQPDGHIKVPAGWLIEQCGWKGKTRGEVGVHHEHALVLVNHGKGTGMALYQLARDIQRSVQEKFNISLVPEVQIVT